MSTYEYETYILTVGDLLMLPQGHADKFDVGKYKFEKSSRQPKFACRYRVSFVLNANGWSDLTQKFNSMMIGLEDALAFYYSMPFIWEWWAFKILKQADTQDRIVISLYEKINGVPMERYHVMPNSDINDLERLISTDEGFAAALYYYNSICRLDSLEYSRSHLPVIFQLIDSLAETEEVEGCKHCGRSKYRRTSRKDVEAMLGKELYKNLYINRGDEEETVRNATMHGKPNSKSLTKICVGTIEDVLLKARGRLISKYSLNGIAPANDRVDLVRFFYDREGTRLAIKPTEGSTLDDYYHEFEKNGLKNFVMSKVGSDW